MAEAKRLHIREDLPVTHRTLVAPNHSSLLLQVTHLAIDYHYHKLKLYLTNFEGMQNSQLVHHQNYCQNANSYEGR